MEAYRIAVNVRLVDEATPALRTLIRTLDLAENAGARLRNALSEAANVRFAASEQLA